MSQIVELNGILKLTSVKNVTVNVETVVLVLLTPIVVLAQLVNT